MSRPQKHVCTESAVLNELKQDTFIFMTQFIYSWILLIFYFSCRYWF